MPRRPRLSLPALLLDASEGYALWDLQGQMVDHNQALANFCRRPEQVADQIADLEEFIDRRKPDFGIIPPVASFRGETVETVIRITSNASSLYHFQCWPVTDSESNVIAVMGRIQAANPESSTLHDDPSRLWGIRLQEELTRRRLAQEPIGLETLCGFGPDHDQLLRSANAAIQAKCNVMIIGEPGTGRHYLARLIHSRWQMNAPQRCPMIPLDPHSLPTDILIRDFLIHQESVKQTSATAKKTASKWRVQAGSTILIEDTMALTADFQNLIGEADENARIISLLNTTESINTLQPSFRAKTSTILLKLKPLRERVEEIPILAQFMLERLQVETTKRFDGLHPAAIHQLQLFDWPANWRDLERTIRLAIQSATGPLIKSEDIPASIQGAYGGAWMHIPKDSAHDLLKESLNQTRRMAVEQALKQFGENKAAAARALGVSRPKLYRIIAELGLD